MHQKNNNQLANQLLQQSPEHILSVLEKTKPEKTDVAQYFLNIGYLQLLSGEFNSAIASFTLAKKEMHLLEAMSISENLAAGTINETFRRYSGYPMDRIMVHNMLALSYLFNNDIDAARVEMLQADVAMKKLAKGKALSGQLASTHLLSAIIYELLNERSNAFISYKLAEGLLTQREMQIPTGLKQGLLRMSHQMGNDQAYRHYSEKYASLARSDGAKKQVFIFYFDGVVDNKIERTIMVPSHNQEQLIRISMPAYPVMNYHLQRLKINASNENVSSELLENIDLLARADLDKEYPSILLLTSSRAIAKYELVEEGNKKDSLLGLLLNIATLLSEVADIRSWNMLPATLQFAYLETNASEIIISSATNAARKVNLGEYKQHVILTSSLSDKIFHYQQ